MKEQNYDSGLKLIITKDGENQSPVIEKGKMVYTDYVGYLEDGTVFSSSENKPVRNLL